MRVALRIGALVAYGAAIVIGWHHHGIPVLGDRVFLWVLGFALAMSVTNIGRFTRGLFVDWLPFIVALTVYDLLRGVADGNLFPPHVKPELWIDKHVFGFGVVPTVFLQNHLWHGGQLRWYDYATWVVYLSHFFVTPLIALGFWLWAPERFRRFTVLVVATSFAAMVTYFVYPAIPPWMASEQHLMPPTQRIIDAVTGQVHVLNGYAVYEKGAAWSNNIAAMPSLHEGLALIATLALWPLAGRVGRVLLVLYPIAMGFALVYSAEHFVTEVVLGLVYGAVVYFVVERIAKARGHAAEPVASPAERLPVDGEQRGGRRRGRAGGLEPAPAGETD